MAHEYGAQKTKRFWSYSGALLQEAVVTPELQTVIKDAYAVFAAYRLGVRLVVCNCPLCMSKASELRLASTPLRRIPAALLAEYTSSAHTWDDGQVADQLRYFLPRYLELIAGNDPPDPIGQSICLRRLGEARWRQRWPPAECGVLERFFDALVAESLSRLDLVEWPVGWRLAFDFADVLTLAVTAGADVDRILVCWDAAADPPAAIHMAALRHDDMLQEHDRTYLHSPFLEDHRDAADRIGAFLLRPEVAARIEAVFFAVDDPRLQQILSDGLAA